MRFVSTIAAIRLGYMIARPDVTGKRYKNYNLYKMNTPSGAIEASREGSKTVEIVAFVGIAGALDIPARLLYTKYRKGAAGQTVVPLVQLQK